EGSEFNLMGYDKNRAHGPYPLLPHHLIKGGGKCGGGGRGRRVGGEVERWRGGEVERWRGKGRLKELLATAWTQRAIQGSVLALPPRQGGSLREGPPRA